MAQLPIESSQNPKIGAAMEISSLQVRDRVAMLKIDSPPVNALGQAVREAIYNGLVASLENPEVEAIVLYCGGRMFFAGADITELGKPLRPPLLGNIIELMESASKPIIAAIHGSALGGGFELSLACHFRAAVPSAKVGLPEVALGLIPGAGGTQRVPRLAGIAAAVEMMVSGRPLTAEAAKRAGLVDELLPEGDLEEGAVAYARSVAEGGAPLRRARDLKSSSGPSETREYLANFRAENADLFRGYKAPDAILKAIEASTCEPFESGLRQEAELSRTLLASPESAAQRYVFFAKRAAGKIPGIPPGVKARSVNAVRVIGDNGEARNIAEMFRTAGFSVNAAASIAGHADDSARWTEELVVDASFLSAEEHPAFFETLETLIAPSAILAVACREGTANVASYYHEAQNIVGLQFSSGAFGALIEIVKARQTADDVILGACSVARRLDSVAIVTQPPTGSVCARLSDVFANSVARLVDMGCDIGHIRNVALGFGISQIPAVEPTGNRRTPEQIDASTIVTDDELIRRLLYYLVDEAAQMLDEGVVLRESDVDLAAIYSLGWPLYKGGPLFWATQLGIVNVVKHLDELHTLNAKAFPQASSALRKLDERKQIVSKT